MLTSRMIEAFQAVIVQGSISDAATFLNISQPAVSRLIRDMEEEVGYRLFERRHGRIYPKNEALELYEEVHRYFMGLNQISLMADQIGKREVSTLRIACLPAIGLSIMPRAIARFQAKYPDVATSLQINRSTTVVQFLNTGRCDIGFVEASNQSPSLMVGPQYEVDTVCVLPDGHRLGALATITPKNLEGEDFVSLNHESQTHARIEGIFNAFGISPKPVIEVPLTHTACSLVLEGCGVSIVDPLMAAFFRPHGLLVRPFEPAAAFNFHSYSTPRVHDSNIARQFFAEFDAVLAQYCVSASR